MSIITHPRTEAYTTNELLDEYKKSGRGDGVGTFEPLLFSGVVGDIYNPSSPFDYGGTTYIMARYEEATDEFSTRVGFFRFDAETQEWQLSDDISNLGALGEGRIFQDPSISYIDGTWLITVVDVVMRDPDDGSKGCDYTSVVYSGPDLQNLSLLCRSPELYKGVRFIELADGRVGMFTRPQSSTEEPEKGGRGKIAFTVLDKVEDITPEAIVGAEIIPCLIDDDEWGGVNDVKLLDDGRLAVLAHLARFVDHPNIKDYREYYPVFFIFDPESRSVSDIKLLLSREDLKLAENIQIISKRDNLRSVLYPAFLRFIGGKALLGMGVSDTLAGVCELASPLPVTLTVLEPHPISTLKLA